MAREEGSNSPFAQFQACQLLQFSALLRWEEMAPGENMAVRSYLAEYLVNRLGRSVRVRCLGVVRERLHNSLRFIGTV